MNFTVIEINNPPRLETLGPNKSVETVWAYGFENRTFYTEAEVYDVECDCDQSSGIFDFELIFRDGVEPFFSITKFGVINFTANESFLGENNESVTYNLTLCVTDLSLESPHENITDFCGQDGLNQTTCQDFGLTVTAENRRPSIVDYNPVGLAQDVSGGELIYFNVTEYDPDGTFPDTYWYVDDGLVEFDSGSLFDEFFYSFSCGVDGFHTVKVLSSDGELNDFVQWNFSVSAVPCPAAPAGSGGGGGGGGGATGFCQPNWACLESWSVCGELPSALESGILAGESYRLISEECFVNVWGESVCGYQTRSCFDVNNCNVIFGEPDELQACYYMANPSCSDGIKNCHSGNCELLVDCGGPCEKCATCSDGIQNQGEEKVDCGGPCPDSCPIIIPAGNVFLNYLLVGVIVILGVIGVIIFLRVRKERGKLR